MNDTSLHDTSGGAGSANTVRDRSGNAEGPSGSHYIIGPLQKASGPRKKKKTAMSHFWDTHHKMAYPLKGHLSIKDHRAVNLGRHNRRRHFSEVHHFLCRSATPIRDLQCSSVQIVQFIPNCAGVTRTFFCREGRGDPACALPPPSPSRRCPPHLWSLTAPAIVCQHG